MLIYHVMHCIIELEIYGVSRCAVRHQQAARSQKHRRISVCKTYAATNKVTDAGWEGIAGSVGVGLIWAALACKSEIWPVKIVLSAAPHVTEKSNEKSTLPVMQTCLCVLCLVAYSCWSTMDMNWYRNSILLLKTM